MNWWVYKNNSTTHTTDRLQGDWHAFFDANCIDEWGYESHVRSLGQIKVGDRILCYQSNRNELVGIARAAQWKSVRDDRYLCLEPLQRVEVKVRPLKKKSPAVARIDAFRSGPIRTLTWISPADVKVLFRACGYDAVPGTATVSRRAPADIEKAFIEGGDRASRSRCRNPRLVSEAKQHYGSRCYCCKFDFSEFYGGRANGLCVVHHLKEFRGDRNKRTTKIADLRVVCGNCHLVLHTEQPAMSVDTLRRIVERRRKNERKKKGAAGVR